MLLVFLLLDAYAKSISKRYEVLKIILTWTLTEFKRFFFFFFFPVTFSTLRLNTLRGLT